MPLSDNKLNETRDLIRDNGEIFTITRGQHSFTAKGMIVQGKEYILFLPTIDIQDGDLLTTTTSNSRFYVTSIDKPRSSNRPHSLHAKYKIDSTS